MTNFLQSGIRLHRLKKSFVSTACCGSQRYFALEVIHFCTFEMVVCRYFSRSDRDVSG